MFFLTVISINWFRLTDSCYEGGLRSPANGGEGDSFWSRTDSILKALCFTIYLRKFQQNRTKRLKVIAAEARQLSRILKNWKSSNFILIFTIRLSQEKQLQQYSTNFLELFILFSLLNTDFKVAFISYYGATTLSFAEGLDHQNSAVVEVFSTFLKMFSF